MPLLPRSLRGRIVAGFAFGASAALVLCLVLLYVLLDRQLGDTLDAGLRDRADDLAAAVNTGGVAVVHRDPMAQLYAADGTVVASSMPSAGTRLLPAGQVRDVRRQTFTTSELTLGQGRRPEAVRLLSLRLGDGRVLTVGASAVPVAAARQRLLVVLLVAAPLLVGLFSVAGWLAVRAALRPVGTLTREAAAISTLETDRKLPAVPGDDEIARLARTLDDMLTRLRGAFARERRFVDDASHELRTPIAVLRGEIELALSAADDPAEVRGSLLAAQGQVDRLGKLADDLLLLARVDAGGVVVDARPVDILDLAVTEARTLARAFALRVEASGDPAVVAGDATRLAQMLGNLVANSAAAGATTVQVLVTRTADAVALDVADDGPGFPEQLAASAFERFVRDDATSPSHAGAGLGLAIVRALATAHHATVTHHNGGPLGGAVVTLTLPVSAGRGR